MTFFSIDFLSIKKISNIKLYFDAVISTFRPCPIYIDRSGNPRDAKLLTNH